MEETTICRICLEPVFNFLCVDCLGNSASSWIDSVRPELLNEFKGFHRSLFKYISSDQNFEKCMKCKNTTDAVICPYCYEREVFWWMFTKDVKLSKIFARIFNFDFLGTGYLPASIKTRNLEPVVLMDKREKSDINICEGCEQASDDLRDENGIWLCESCREM
jgi:hypothetical protein